jgi:hypothetical protein
MGGRDARDQPRARLCRRPAFFAYSSPLTSSAIGYFPGNLQEAYEAQMEAARVVFSTLGEDVVVLPVDARVQVFVSPASDIENDR